MAKAYPPRSVTDPIKVGVFPSFRYPEVKVLFHYKIPLSPPFSKGEMGRAVNYVWGSLRGLAPPHPLPPLPFPKGKGIQGLGFPIPEFML